MFEGMLCSVQTAYGMVSKRRAISCPKDEPQGVQKATCTLSKRHLVRCPKASCTLSKAMMMHDSYSKATPQDASRPIAMVYGELPPKAIAGGAGKPLDTTSLDRKARRRQYSASQRRIDSLIPHANL